METARQSLEREAGNSGQSTALGFGARDPHRFSKGRKVSDSGGVVVEVALQFVDRIDHVVLVDGAPDASVLLDPVLVKLAPLLRVMAVEPAEGLQFRDQRGEVADLSG